MRSHYESYKTKEPAELHDLLQMATEITYESKLALQKVIIERHLAEFENATPYKVLINSIEEDRQEVEDLLPLKRIGLELKEDRNALIFKSNKASFWRDFFALLLGIVLMLCIIPTVNSIIAMQEHNISFLAVIMLIGQVVITLSGLGLTVRAIERMYFFKSFFVNKKGNSILTQKRDSFKVEQKEFAEGGLHLSFVEGDCEIVATSSGENYPVFKVEDPNYKLIKTLETVCEKINNYK